MKHAQELLHAEQKYQFLIRFGAENFRLVDGKTGVTKLLLVALTYYEQRNYNKVINCFSLNNSHCTST
jgi:hypothetical protein